MAISLLRDIFYGSLEYAIRTLRLRKAPGKADIADVARDFLRTLGAGIFTPVGENESTDATNLKAWQSVAGRLEKAATRMEAVSAKTED